ncbi:hypothetical protein CLAFUW4_12663 [Fulvia fulva]|uniref:Uncharacterized protein n=1 Tax=Passalora fulva TaxID=5499 RepID=A0A9Q8PJE8_PASFU|nr:uncharacterized protein CLAFUR5_12531 [Fulvia fulva]KAK4611552.1 hypothetical protein CLAFUR4_12668 [Fulvia fulva]UJO23583.1 hypothetical protein CLAFUR5_12531 [Fulvia fulva]WPV21421.1 hypothetical protein CLAFUW4_12663 [Fulvia fulva]WPV35831.1 hypothetical protein CLAFUW7_12670 [Fulvia fulva]
MSDEYSQTATLAAPGHHNVWSQVSLPPSTPKALAQGVLDYALKQVYDKLMRLRSRAITHEVFKQDSSQEFAARLEADPKIPDEPEYEEESSESAISILVSSPPNKPTPIPPGTMDRPTPEVSSARPFSGLDPQAAEFSPTPTARR